MIEINLVPDVKQELIHAQRMRATVISISVIVGVAALGLVGALLIFMGGQALSEKFIDDTIKKESAKLAEVKDINSSLTIQNQLATLTAIHEGKYINSRIFDVLATIAPSDSELSPFRSLLKRDENEKITMVDAAYINKFIINTEEKTILLEGQAKGGFSALEEFKKTILATKLQYVEITEIEEDGQVKESREVKEVPLTTHVNDIERSSGRDAENNNILRFTITFPYPDELFKPYLRDAKIIGPTVTTNVTDSYLGIPKEVLSGESAKEENN